LCQNIASKYVVKEDTSDYIKYNNFTSSKENIVKRQVLSWSGRIYFKYIRHSTHINIYTPTQTEMEA
jgi:hypothetical protein